MLVVLVVQIYELSIDPLLGAIGEFATDVVAFRNYSIL